MEKLLLIDGSSILTTCFYGNLPIEYMNAKTDEERDLALPKLLQTSDGIYTNAIYGFCKTLDKIKNNLKPDYITIAWDLNRETFRKKLYDKYKAHRKKTRQELSSQFIQMQKILEEMNITSIGINGYEADDIIGSIAEKHKNDVEIIILTKDQDALQLLGDNVSVWLTTSKVKNILNDLSMKKSDISYCSLDKTFPFTPETFEKYYGFKPTQIIDYKAISGDPSDNIPGISGVGEKSAINLIKEFGSLENIVDFLKDASESDIEEKKKELKNKGITRVPFKAIIDDIKNENLGLLSKKLATIKKDIKVPELKELRFKINEEKRKEIYERLQFKSLL